MSLINFQGGFNLTGAALKLARYYNLHNVAVINVKNSNPYDGQIPASNKGVQPIYGLSSLGTPIYSDLLLKGCSYTDNLTGNLIVLPNDRVSKNGAAAGDYKNGYYQELETVLITIEQPIRIVKTEIQGRDGTVKEYIGKDDAKLTINGIITGTNGVYPTGEVTRLKKWLDAPISKELTAWWLNQLGISQIVVESYNLPQMEGGISYQMFTINAISDMPIELKEIMTNV
ncbi:hypothetical protein UFOVP153_56 [uncultured Caudovirales phage]|uniref:DUF6046 domain-containing protein n=1 Tax=uncultured Caudovirales phage TaxID=2100421 RepID=A0A6J7WA46_9CAUD|nr:hypothetical protein UFOVP69_2 [uncultured Caudovirales phage]CAB5171044.1 hypothetical protein UFOVP153_56 [uncultured Caudovirales phage]